MLESKKVRSEHRRRVLLNWRNQWVFRFSAEYQLAEQWTVGAGYRFARSAVPSSTLTPFNEHVVSVGLGYSFGGATVDLAWQWQIPANETVDRSCLGPR